MESMKDYEKELERSFRDIQPGDIIEGTVIAVNEEEVTLDLNYYTQGFIKAENLSNEPGFNILEEVEVGQTIQAAVLSTGSKHGIELSKKEANDTLSWEKFKEWMDEEKIITVKIKEAVNAGVVSYVEGIRGFIPASQLAADYVEDLSSWVGKNVEVKVITVDKAKKKLVMSGKVVARERQTEEKNRLIDNIIPGTVMEGVVESLMPYGAFVSLGNGMSGLVHISQICRKRIGSPREVLKEGQKVQVKVLNTNNHKISLSMKALEETMPEESDVESAEKIKVEEYSDGQEATTGLGALLKGLKL